MYRNDFLPLLRNISVCGVFYIDTLFKQHIVILRSPAVTGFNLCLEAVLVSCNINLYNAAKLTVRLVYIVPECVVTDFLYAFGNIDIGQSLIVAESVRINHLKTFGK